MQTCYWQLQEHNEAEQAYAEAAALIQQGEVVAFPTETVYGLGADGLNGEAVTKIFLAKGRPNDNPLILHIADLKDIEPLTTGLNANARALAKAFWPGPLTLVVNKSALVPQEVSAGLPTVAVRFPANRYAQDFIKACGCPIAAPSANLSGRPSPTNAQDVLEDMQGKIAGILDGGSCAIGVESTIVDTTEAVPTILRPGGITYEMLTEVLGFVEIDKGLLDDKNFKPKAPGMKYRHYAPKASMYLLEGEATKALPAWTAKALTQGLRVGVLCSETAAKALPRSQNLLLSVWHSKEELAAELFYLLRDFDRTCPAVILAEGVSEEGLGLALMNRMRKAAGYQEVVAENGCYRLKNGAQLPAFLD